jgi:hypothetical protein
MSFIDTTPANSIYPALPTGQYPSTAILQSQLTSQLDQQTMYAYVSSVNAAAGPTAPRVQFTSYMDYMNYKQATFANRSDPNKSS